MAKTMRGYPTAQLQQKVSAEPQNNPGVQQLEEWPHAKECKVVVDYEPDIDYKPKWPVSNDKPVAQEEEEENSKADLVKMQFYCKQ